MVEANDKAGPDSSLPLTCVRWTTIDAAASEWDQFVSRDAPHLRAGFLRATERSQLIRDPEYRIVSQGGRPVAAALAYTLLVDVAGPKPPAMVAWIRKVFPGYLWKSQRICGSPIQNAESGIYFDPLLTPSVRRQVFARIVQEVLQTAPRGAAIFFKEFTAEAIADYASQLEGLGFFPINVWPGTRLDLVWPDYDHYLGAMRKRYRQRIRKDLKEGEALEYQLLDSFADLAKTTTALYREVVARAPFSPQVANEIFFRTVSDFDQSRLLVARRRGSGEVLGVNLLLFGDTCMHNTYIGFNYAENEHFPLYFNLALRSLRIAMEKGCKVCYLGQAAYDFKTRQGAVLVPLTGYAMHRTKSVHNMLFSAREKLFPPAEEVVAHNVFHAAGGEE